jgi:hypothetical protein
LATALILFFSSTIHPFQLAACPETDDMLVSFATEDKNAFENPVHYFNLFELLNFESPS